MPEAIPRRFASVVLVDTTQPEARDNLRRLADQGASGVRLRPGARSPGDDPLAVWRTVADLGLSVSSPGSATDFTSPDFGKLLTELPGLRVVLEHLGGAARPDADLGVLHVLSAYPNVYIKVPGLGEIAQRAPLPMASSPFARPIPASLEVAYAAFGPERMLWGSDFPPVAAREGYRNALRLCRAEFADRPANAQDLIFGDVAASVFPLR